MRPEEECALEFIQSAQGLASIDTLIERFSEAAGLYGFRRFQCTHLAAPGKLMRPRLLFGPSSPWTEKYFEGGWWRRDPAIQQVFSSLDPFTYSECEARSDASGKAVFEAVRSTGIVEGFVVPVHGVYGEIYSVVMSAEAEFDPAARPVLAMMARVYATVGLPLVEVDQDKHLDRPLTKREAECLYWVFQAKSDWMIGKILEISPRTVEMHVDRAKKKLGAANRTQAVAFALQRGLLFPPDED